MKTRREERSEEKRGEDKRGEEKREACFKLNKRMPGVIEVVILCLVYLLRHMVACGSHTTGNRI